MTPADRRRVARVLREAARIVAEWDDWRVYEDGACDAILAAADDYDGALDSFYTAMYRYSCSTYFWPRDEEHRSVRVIALLLTAEAVLTGDCDD